MAALRDVKGVRRIEYAGSLRRMAETIGDVDILVASETSAPIMEAFVGLPLVAEVIGSGETKTSVRTSRGLQVDLRVVPPGAWGAALHYFTGSKAHNIRIREIAVRKKLKLSEYGLFRVDGDELLVAETEEEVYERLGMQWIPPTLREDRGEVEAALAHGASRSHPAEGPPRRPAHAHEPDRRPGDTRADDRHGRGPEVRVLRGHRPRARTCTCSG